MKRNFIDLCLIAAMSAALCSSGPGRAQETAESAEAKAKLAEVRGRIQALTTRLGSELQERDQLAARLRDAELDITALRFKLDALRGAAAAVLRQRRELLAEESRVQRALDAERGALAAEVRAAYMRGEHERLKLLLTQSDPASAGRMSAFYGYFARERARRIGDINERVNELAGLVAQVDQTGTRLEALESGATQELAGLQRARAERTAALTAINQQVRSGSAELAQLKREEQAEEALLAELARVLEDFPIDTQQSFAALRGKLPWPVPGRMAAHIPDEHANLGQAGLRRNGVVIESTRGAKVRAPYFGRVLYADWLQGLGLLLIIGHTGNYMTLYGHAEVLYKSVGDWVAPGDVIAGLSDSGGSIPQLYFEIRQGRAPLDPKAWLKGSP